jgi:hypothetical protein
MSVSCRSDLTSFHSNETNLLSFSLQHLLVGPDMERDHELLVVGAQVLVDSKISHK